MDETWRRGKAKNDVCRVENDREWEREREKIWEKETDRRGESEKENGYAAGEEERQRCSGHVWMEGGADRGGARRGGPRAR